MANTKSAEKRLRQSERRRQSNRHFRSRMRTAIKRLRSTVQNGDAEQAKELLPGTLRVIDETAQKGVIHRNAAARHKSRLSKAVGQL